MKAMILAQALKTLAVCFCWSGRRFMMRYPLIRSVLAIVTFIGIAVFLRKYAMQGSGRPTTAEISALAQDTHVVVGEVPLVLPFIAFFYKTLTLERRADREKWWEARDAFRVASSVPATAPALKTVDVYLADYGWAKDIQIDVLKTICSQLARASV